MKVAAALLLVLLGSVSAFAPVILRNRATCLTAKIDSEFGVSFEAGGKAPPLGAYILEDASPGALKWFQNAEIKNGRVAMVATIGYMVQKFGIHFPLYLGPSAFAENADTWYLSPSAGITFADISKAAPLEAIQMVPLTGWAQVLVAAGAFELTAWDRQWNQENSIPGNYGFDPLGFTKREGGWDSEELTRLREKEIKNGRLAM
jgi:hypothetical protein